MIALIGFFSISGLFASLDIVLTRLLPTSPSTWAILTSWINRYAPRRSRDFPSHAPQQASHDVQRHLGKGNPRDVQEIHEQCTFPVYPPAIFSFFIILTNVIPFSLSKSLSTTNPNLPSTVSSSTSFDSRKPRRIAS